MFDERTLKEYLEDVKEMETGTRHQKYSQLRQKILTFWRRAMRDRCVSLEDPLPHALEKVRQEMIVWRRAKKRLIISDVETRLL